MHPMIAYGQANIRVPQPVFATGRFSRNYQDPTPPPSIPDTPTAPSSTTYPTTPTDSDMPSPTTTAPASGNNMPTWINNMAFGGCCSKESPLMKQVTGGQPPSAIRQPQNIPPGGSPIALAWKGYTRFDTDRPETISNPNGLSSLSGSPNSGPREAGPNGVLPEPPNDTVAPSSANEPAPPQSASLQFSRALQNTGPSAAGSVPSPSGVSPNGGGSGGGGGKSGGNLFCCFRPRL